MKPVATPLAVPVRAAVSPATTGVELRPMPYPFRAMLAICSDLDETPDLEAYLDTLRFLNSDAHTRGGRGLGLETGNTIYFDMPPDQFSYWNTGDRGRAVIRDLIRSGHIDCLHSFGDLAATRAHAARALDELDRHGCRLDVWIDHAVAPTNFGADIMHGQGDVVGSPAYHADLTCAFGVRYVWRGRVTSVAGQDVPRRLGGVFHPGHPLVSTRTVAKELAKGVLGRAGSPKYRMHAGNALLRAAQLRDGQPAWEFLRANPHWGGVSSGDTAAGLGDVLDRVVPRVIARGGACVLYTHLGKPRQPGVPYSPRTAAALRNLADQQASGQILVTTTRRLLGYARARQDVAWSLASGDGLTRIAVRTTHLAFPLVRRDLEGLTWYVDDPAATLVTLNGVPVRDLRGNPPDQTGRGSVSLPWSRLEFPQV